MKKDVKQSRPIEERPVGSLLLDYAIASGLLNKDGGRDTPPDSQRLKSPKLPDGKHEE